MNDDQILFYYRKRLMIISEEMRKTGYIVLRGESVRLTYFVDMMFDLIPEQTLEINDPEFDENVPYIIMSGTNPLIKERIKL